MLTEGSPSLQKGLYMRRIMGALNTLAGLPDRVRSVVWCLLLVLEVQHALKSKGYDPGAVDGVYGPKTQAAVRDFERVIFQ